MKIVDKVCDIFDIFLEREGQANIVTLTKASGLNKSTVYRICNTLSNREYLYHKDYRGNFTLGLKFSQFFTLSEIFSKVKDITSPYLESLCKETSETVVLSTLKKNELINISVFNSKHRLQMFTNEGDLMPLHCTAMGKILLASLIEEEFNRILKTTELSRYTDNTITDMSDLNSELRTIKKRGIAFDSEEYELGSRGIATPVKNNIGRVVAAIGIIGPASRISLKRLKDLAPVIKLTSRQINEAMCSN
jgi:IclR family transcriptional regulator, KDG regulon repressor